jgi:hypothetical protein
MIEDANGLKVVPNKKLKSYLLKIVPARASKASLVINQNPESTVESDAYIGTVAGDVSRGVDRIGGGVSGLRRNDESDVGHISLNVSQLVGYEMDRLGLGIAIANSSIPDEVLKRTTNLAAAFGDVAISTGFAESRDSILKAHGPTKFEYNTGLNVFGMPVKAILSPTMQANILQQGEGFHPTVVQIDPRGRRQDTLAIKFGNGSGTVIAGLQGYVANVIVDASGVKSVCYVPAESENTGQTYFSEQLDQIHALVATAAKYSTFRVEGSLAYRNSDAERLANFVRIGNRIDPTLSLYVAYTYADAGLETWILHLREKMKRELAIDLFDVAMLADATDSSSDARAPFCPMLSQGWTLLRVHNVQLGVIRNARDHVLPSLWATFDSEGMDIVTSALQLRDLR